MKAIDNKMAADDDGFDGGTGDALLLVSDKLGRNFDVGLFDGDGDECRNGGHPHCTDGAGTLLLLMARHELECRKFKPSLHTKHLHWSSPLN